MESYVVGQLVSLVVVLAIACGTLIFYKHPSKGGLDSANHRSSDKTFSPRNRKG